MKILISVFTKDLESGEGLAAALRELQHDAFLIHADRFHWGIFAVSVARHLPFKFFKHNYWKKYKQITNKRILCAARAYLPNIYISIGGEHVYPEIIREISREGKTSSVCWVTDEAATLDEDDPCRWFNFSAYDHIFCVDELWGQSFQLFPIPRSYMPFAGDVRAYKLGNNAKKDIDVLFLGDFFPPHPHTASGYGRAVILSSILHEGISVAVCGSGLRAIARYFPEIRTAQVIPHPKSSEARNALYNRAKITVFLNPMLLKTDFTSELYNIALSGAFILTDEKKNAKKLFGETLQTFQNRTELISKIKQYLADVKGRIAIAKSTQVIATEHHTYSNRARFFVDELEKMHGK